MYRYGLPQLNSFAKQLISDKKQESISIELVGAKLFHFITSFLIEISVARCWNGCKMLECKCDLRLCAQQPSKN